MEGGNQSHDDEEEDKEELRQDHQMLSEDRFQNIYPHYDKERIKKIYKWYVDVDILMVCFIFVLILVDIDHLTILNYWIS